jgi:hypothetical protein
MEHLPMRWVCILVAAVLLPRIAAGAVKRSDQDRVIDNAVDKALKFLQSVQEADGAWKAGGRKDPAITGLAVMAFLSAGHVPGEGPFGTVVEKGVRWVLKSQHANGLIGTVGNHEMYHHGICTLMLAEVAGMTSDKDLARDIRARLVKAVEVILAAQRQTRNDHHGGWRYQIRDVYRGGDISCTGWQLLALRAAKNVGCDVPQQRIAWAVAFIKRCRDPRTGGFCYMPGGGLTIPCTGTSILGLEICGKDWHRTDEAKKAGAYLNNHPPRWGDGHFFYGIYYCSQAMFQLGGNYWKSYRPKLHKVLLDHRNGNGCWIGNDGYGPNYSTAMAVLALTVEYRYLPIYQRNEEEDKAN